MRKARHDRGTAGDESAEAAARIAALLGEAVARRASDVHLEPITQGYELRHRVDGVLSPIRQLSADAGNALVNQLMVAAQLLTYRRGVPQEGRVSVELEALSGAEGAGDLAIDGEAASGGVGKHPLDLRLSVMPTTRGMRAVVRLPAELLQPRTLETLGLPSAVVSGLERFIAADSGMLILCGPAGSGKTTTTYALLESIVAHCPGQSVLSLEDPVERQLEGVTQIEVQPFGELTFEAVLRSVLRQDPQVLAVGEVRDAETAKIAVGAALSGHRLVTTLHAASPERALVRLVEMGVEPYQAASAVVGVVSLRLLRRGTEAQGYHGRVPVAEYLPVDDAVRRAVLARADAAALRGAVAGVVSMREHAQQLVEAGVTDAAEVGRVLGTAAGPA